MKYCPIVNDECIQESFICDDCFIYKEYIDDCEIAGRDEELEINEFDCFDDEDSLVNFINYEEQIFIDEDDLPF